MLSLIVAKADNGVIGRDNQLPWYLPADLKHFKARTMGKPIVMGRKTFDSLGRVLPGRPHVVITRDLHLQLPENCYRVKSLADAIAQGQQLTTEQEPEVVIIGGAQIYNQALGCVDRLYVTEVHQEPEGDAQFPEIDLNQWKEVEREDHSGDIDYSFVTYQKNV